MMSVKSSGDLPTEVGMESQPLWPLPGLIRPLCVFVCVLWGEEMLSSLVAGEGRPLQ